MTDRTGQTWEFDMVVTDDEKLQLRRTYIVVRSWEASLRETDGVPATSHCFLCVDDGTVGTWWERDEYPYEQSADRRRLA